MAGVCTAAGADSSCTIVHPIRAGPRTVVSGSMALWLAEFAARIIAVPLLLDVLGEGLFVTVAALSILIGSLQWLVGDNKAVARVAYIARRVQGPPESSWQTATNSVYHSKKHLSYVVLPIIKSE